MKQNFYFDIKNFTFSDKKNSQLSESELGYCIDKATEFKKIDNEIFTKKPFFVRANFDRYIKGYIPKSELNIKEYIWLTFLGKNLDFKELGYWEFIEISQNIFVYYFINQPRAIIYNEGKNFFVEYDFFSKNAYIYPCHLDKVLLSIIVYSDYYDKSYNLIKLNDYCNKKLNFEDKGVCQKHIQDLEKVINSKDEINYENLNISLITKLKMLNKKFITIFYYVIIFILIGIIPLIMQFLILDALY